MSVINNKILKKDKDSVIYLLTIGDLQNVANQEIGRDLRLKEIKKTIDKVADKINWYDAIAYSILESEIK